MSNVFMDTSLSYGCHIAMYGYFHGPRPSFCPSAGENWGKALFTTYLPTSLVKCIDFNKIGNNVNAGCSVHAADLMSLSSHDDENVKRRTTILNNVDPAGAVCINDVTTSARREVCWWLYTIDDTVNKCAGDVSVAVKIQLPYGRKRSHTHQLAPSGVCIIAFQA